MPMRGGAGWKWSSPREGGGSESSRPSSRKPVGSLSFHTREIGQGVGSCPLFSLKVFLLATCLLQGQRWSFQ